jgi:hypothetical protein
MTRSRRNIFLKTSEYRIELASSAAAPKKNNLSSAYDNARHTKAIRIEEITTAYPCQHQGRHLAYSQKRKAKRAV